MKLFLSSFLLFFCFIGSLLASHNNICEGNLCVEFKTALKEQDFVLVNDLYEKLLTSFEAEDFISYVNWSTMVDLTKSYAQVCIKQGNIDGVLFIVNRLLQKYPPETFYQQLFILKESLNPNKLSLGSFLKGLEQIRKRDSGLFLDTQDTLFFNACKYFVVDYLESLRQQANKSLFIGNYDQALMLYKQMIHEIKQGELPVLEQDKFLILSELEVLEHQAILKQVESELQIDDKTIAFANYFCVKKKHENLLTSIFHSLKNNKNLTCSLDLGRNLLDLANFYYINHCQDEAKEVLKLLIQRLESVDRTFRLVFLKLLFISCEQKDFVQLGVLLDKGSQFFSEKESEYPEFCLYQGIFSYYQKKFDESQAYIKLSMKKPEVLGLKMPLALQYLGYSLLDYADTQIGERKEILLEEAYNVFLLLFNNWDKIEGLLGCFYVKAKQKDTSWNLGEKLIKDNLGRLSLSQQQLLFNLNLIFRIFPNFIVEKDIQTNSFYLLWSLISKLPFEKIHDHESSLKGISLSFEKIIVSLLRYEKEKKLFGIENFIQRFLNESIKKFLDKCLSYPFILERPSISWYISLIRELYIKEFQFAKMELKEYYKNYSLAQREILFCIEALKLSCSQSKNKMLTFLEQHITGNSSYPQELLKILFLENASEQTLSAKRKDLFLWTENSYFSEEIFFKIFPLYSYIRGDKGAINHLYKFASLFPDSQLISVVLYFLGVHQEDPIKSIYYFSTALEDYININPHIYNQNPFTYFFYKTKLELSLSLVQRTEQTHVMRAIEILERIKEDFSCLQHPLIRDLKKRYDTLEFELSIDYLLTYSFLKLGEKQKLEQHLFATLKKYTPFFDNPTISRFLYFLWSLQKKLAEEIKNKDLYEACENIILKMHKNNFLVKDEEKSELLPLSPLL